MTLSSFGKGIGALGWAVSPTRLWERSRGLRAACSTCGGNLSSIVIGYIIVAANALLAAFSYLVIVGEIKRMVLVK